MAIEVIQSESEPKILRLVILLYQMSASSQILRGLTFAKELNAILRYESWPDS